jgi:quercetin dioxygenase-like cupin family protein
MSDTQRLRARPDERFESPVVHFNLHAIGATLRAEPHRAVAGHRQIAIYKREHTTVVVYAFERDGEIPVHTAEGLVMLQTLRGRVHVDCDGDSYELTPGQIVILAAGVPHAVRASEPSEMILTVQKIPGAGSENAR